VTVVPHPFQRSRHGVRAADIGRPDAIEVYNAHTLTGFRNRQAAAFAEQHGLPGVGGSDAHAPQLVGRAATELRVDPSEPTTDAILAAVRAGRTAARGRRTTTGQYLRKYVTNTRIRAVDGFGASFL
jgi:predicted metal-dependent phosphoesterase TrpH